MAKLDDNQIIAMLAEIRDSPPPISPIKSPQKNLSDLEDEIPSSQPASTRENATVGLKRARLMTREQEKNVSADTKALTDLKDSLATMFPDKNKREQAERRI